MSQLGRDPEQLVQQLVATARDDPTRRAELVDMLREDHPCYTDVGTPAVVRMRGWILKALGEVGVPADGYPYVAEQLESGVDAYLTAAAAHALDGLPATDEHADLLRRALQNLRYRDDMVSFERYGEYSKDTRGVTALQTIEAALGRVEQALSEAKPKGSCCGGGGRVSASKKAERPSDLLLEDQDGGSTTFDGYFVGQPSFVVFFYTRCSNPHKCLLTVTKLGRLQRRLGDANVRTAGFTYDPGFDNPARLHAYGESLDVRFAENHRLFRTPADYERLQDYFTLGVSRHGSVVSHHRIEAFVLDANGGIVETFTHRQWDVDEVVELLTARARQSCSS